MAGRTGTVTDSGLIRVAGLGLGAGLGTLQVGLSSALTHLETKLFGVQRRRSAMFAVALNYLLSLALVLVAFGLAWGAARLPALQARSLSSESSRPLMFLIAAAFLLVAGIGEVGMTHNWSSNSVAAGLDQGVFLVLMTVGAFLLVLEYFARRPVK